MKKFLTLFLVLVMGLALAACGSDEKKKEEGSNADVSTGDKGDDSASGDTAGEEPEFTDEFYKQVYDMLKEKGYELEVLGAEPDNIMLDVTDNNRIVINKEEMLPIQIFTIEPGSEYLAGGKENGEWPLEYEGEQGMVPVIVVGDEHFVFFGEGHPDYADVMAAIQELK